MPKKLVKLSSGVKVEIKSFLLPNGNLVIPARMEQDRNIADWIEVEPGTSDHKRWLPIAVDEPDPRTDPTYIDWRNDIEQSDDRKAWREAQKEAAKEAKQDDDN